MRRFEVTLGMVNGMLIGFALAMGLWVNDALALSAAHYQFLWPMLALGLVALMALGALAGGLAARSDHGFLAALIWLIAAGLMFGVAGQLPYTGRTWLLRALAGYAWPESLYVFGRADLMRLAVSAFFGMLILVILGALQGYRLQAIAGEQTAPNRLSARGWFLLLLPLLLVAWSGFTVDDFFNRPLRAGPMAVSRAIEGGRTYPGDLRELSRSTGLNYQAIADVRAQMSARYSLQLAEIHLGDDQTLVVTADFDNGAWINCEVFVERLTYCYDARLAYTRGLSALVKGEVVPNCLQCKVETVEANKRWLRENAQWLGDTPVLERLGQWGSVVLMRASVPGGPAIECVFSGLRPVQLRECRAVTR